MAVQQDGQNWVNSVEHGSMGGGHGSAAQQCQQKWVANRQHGLSWHSSMAVQLVIEMDQQSQVSSHRSADAAAWQCRQKWVSGMWQHRWSQWRR